MASANNVIKDETTKTVTIRQERYALETGDLPEGLPRTFQEARPRIESRSQTQLAHALTSQ